MRADEAEDGDKQVRTIRPIEIETCCICGEQYEKGRMIRMFTGRVRYMCPECYARSNREIAARRSIWEDSERGKRAISIAVKNK